MYAFCIYVCVYIYNTHTDILAGHTWFWPDALFIYMYVAHLRTLFLPVALQSVTCCDRLQADHHQKKKRQKKITPPCKNTLIGMHSYLSLHLIYTVLRADYANPGPTRADVTVLTEEERRCVMTCLDLALCFTAKLRISEQLRRDLSDRPGSACRRLRSSCPLSAQATYCTTVRVQQDWNSSLAPEFVSFPQSCGQAPVRRRGGVSNRLRGIRPRETEQALHVETLCPDSR